MADAESAIPVSDMLQRALQIALCVRDQVRAEQVRDALFQLLSRVNETWGWVTLFDIFEEQRKVVLSELQRDAIVAAFEAYIASITVKPEGEEPATAFHLAARLVRHYQRLGQQPHADRVVLAAGQAAERRAASAGHTVAHFWLDHCALSRNLGR